MYSKAERRGVQQRMESLTSEMFKGGIRYDEALAAFRKAFISVALRENNGNLSRTAPALGVHRNSLARFCFELGIDASQFRTRSRRPPARAQQPLIVKRAVRQPRFFG